MNRSHSAKIFLLLVAGLTIAGATPAAGSTAQSHMEEPVSDPLLFDRDTIVTNASFRIMAAGDRDPIKR